MQMVSKIWILTKANEPFINPKSNQNDNSNNKKWNLDEKAFENTVATYISTCWRRKVFNRFGHLKPHPTPLSCVQGWIRNSDYWFKSKFSLCYLSTLDFIYKVKQFILVTNFFFGTIFQIWMTWSRHWKVKYRGCWLLSFVSVTCWLEINRAKYVTELYQKRFG